MSEGHKIEIRTKAVPGTHGPRPGQAIEILLDGQPLKQVRNVTLKLPADGVVTLEIELMPENISAILDTPSEVKYTARKT